MTAEYENERVNETEHIKELEIERDIKAQEIGEAQKTVEELTQQLSANAAELETERQEKAAAAERLNALEGELAGVKGERDTKVRR